MTADTRLRDAIAAAIGEVYVVGCGRTIGDEWSREQRDRAVESLLPLVVAEVRSAAATAFDEGVWAGKRHTAGFKHPIDANPYRVEEAGPAEIPACFDTHECETRGCYADSVGVLGCMGAAVLYQRSATRVDEPATPSADPDWSVPHEWKRTKSEYLLGSGTCECGLPYRDVVHVQRSAARVDEPATPPAELWCMYCNAWHTPAGCEVIGSAGEGSSS